MGSLYKVIDLEDGSRIEVEPSTKRGEMYMSSRSPYDGKTQWIEYLSVEKAKKLAEALLAAVRMEEE